MFGIDDGSSGSADRSSALQLVVDSLGHNDARDAVRSVLASGSLIALELDYQIELFHRYFRVQPTPSGPMRDCDRTAASLHRRLDTANATMLRMFSSVRTIVIEDEYALRTHPVRPGCAFVDERVLRWRSLTPDPVVAAEYLRAGRHGVPLCAYLSTLGPDELRLRAGANISSWVVGRLANSIVAIVVPDGDEDAHLLACRVEPDLTQLCEHPADGARPD